MKDNLKDYINTLNKILEKNKIENKKKILEEILLQIKFFQHERLVHLIVTFFVGIACILFLGFALILNNLGFLCLFFLTFILFIPYIFHYYYLENGVQTLYKKYFELEEKQ